MQSLLFSLMIPFLILNSLGAIVAGIWLGILGEWWAIGYGIAGLFASMLLGLILMIGMVFTFPAIFLIEKGKNILALPFLFLNVLYTNTIITLWCMGVFLFFITQVINAVLFAYIRCNQN